MGAEQRDWSGGGGLERRDLLIPALCLVYIVSSLWPLS